MVKTKIVNILIVGVGGQGVMTLGKIIQEYGMLDPEITDVVASESRGVSQREGSVYSAIRFIYGHNDSKRNPIIAFNLPLQGVDVVIGLEPLEFYRNLKYLKHNSQVLLNTHEILPKSLLLSKKGEASINYPTNKQVQLLLQKIFPKVKVFMKNYTQFAINETGKSINANRFILKDLPDEIPEIFKKIVFKKMENFISF